MHMTKLCEKGYPMRFKATFLAGFAVGFVAGARAGRERYEQMVKASRKVAENPTVQKAAKTAGAKATELTKVAKDKAAERAPKLTETAKSGASKMRGQIDRLPGRHAAESEPAAVNGTRPAD
jgi:glutamate-1-semialdehyde aminotransferase